MVWAQNAFFPSNKDYGFTGILIGDNYSYPTDSLDRERLRITYLVSVKTVVPGPVTSSSTWVLQLGSRFSRFVCRDRYEADSLMKASPRNLISISKCYSRGDPYFFFDAYYRNYTTSSIQVTGRIGSDDFLYNDPLPGFTWTIKDSTQTICGYTCRLAKCYFRGRYYAAWFTEEIPISAGPWKMSGLPGVILFLEEDSGQYSFCAVSIKPSYGCIEKSRYPYITIKRNSFLRVRKQLQMNYVSCINSHLGRSNALGIEMTEDLMEEYPIFDYIELE